MELHTYIECSKCGSFVRASKHTPEECKALPKLSEVMEK